MKKTILIISCVAIIVSFAGCSNYGKEKDFDGVELYHTQNVTDGEADKLGDFLVSSKFADGHEKTVQLTKTGSTYNFRFVVKKESANDPNVTKSFKYFASILSAKVFNGAQVNLDVCDDQLKTLSTFASEELGTLKTFDGIQLYHTKSIPDALADSLGNYLISSKFADGNEKTVQINKPAGIYQFKFIIKSGFEKDNAYLKNTKIFASELSGDVFKRAPVEVRLCDEFFNTLVVVPMNPLTK